MICHGSVVAEPKILPVHMYIVWLSGCLATVSAYLPIMREYRGTVHVALFTAVT